MPRGSTVATGQGPGRVLVVVYTTFAVAAGARSAYQIATRFSAAPLAYSLSAVAAVVYVVAAVALRRETRPAWRAAVVAVLVELVGVLAVGTFTVVDTSAFPDATVWSDFGSGYGYIPLVLPVAGLAWLRHTRPG